MYGITVYNINDPRAYLGSSVQYKPGTYPTYPTSSLFEQPLYYSSLTPSVNSLFANLYVNYPYPTYPNYGQPINTQPPPNPQPPTTDPANVPTTNPFSGYTQNNFIVGDNNVINNNIIININNSNDTYTGPTTVVNGGTGNDVITVGDSNATSVNNSPTQVPTSTPTPEQSIAEAAPELVPVSESESSISEPISSSSTVINGGAGNDLIINGDSNSVSFGELTKPSSVVSQPVTSQQSEPEPVLTSQSQPSTTLVSESTGNTVINGGAGDDIIINGNNNNISFGNLTRPQEPTPQPTPEPNPQPVPNPEPNPTPTPEPIPEPQPTPEPVPDEPTPTPQPTPEPNPQPVPDPEPQPVPEPNPTPTPEPTPEPQPNPEPVPDEPAPTPQPNPEPNPTPQPTPTHPSISDIIRKHIKYAHKRQIARAMMIGKFFNNVQNMLQRLAPKFGIDIEALKAQFSR